MSPHFLSHFWTILLEKKTGNTDILNISKTAFVFSVSSIEDSGCRLAIPEYFLFKSERKIKMLPTLLRKAETYILYLEISELLQYTGTYPFYILIAYKYFLLLCYCCNSD